jgi:hypothetical protein
MDTGQKPHQPWKKGSFPGVRIDMKASLAIVRITFTYEAPFGKGH